MYISTIFWILTISTIPAAHPLPNISTFAQRFSKPSFFLRRSLGHARRVSNSKYWKLRRERCKLRLIVALIPKTAGRDLQVKLMDECSFISCEDPALCFKAGAGIMFVHIRPKNQPFRAAIWKNSKDYNFTLLSFLRDPVERVISEYYFFKDKTGAFSNWTNIMKDRGWHTLEQYAKALPNRNYMSGFLLGYNMWSHVVTDEESKQLLQNVRDGFKRRLLFLGIMEEYVMSWRLLKMHIGLPPRTRNDDGHHINANENKEPVDDSLRLKIRNWNRLDAELYDLGLSHLRNLSKSADSKWWEMNRAGRG